MNLRHPCMTGIHDAVSLGREQHLQSLTLLTAVWTLGGFGLSLDSSLPVCERKTSSRLYPKPIAESLGGMCVPKSRSKRTTLEGEVFCGILWNCLFPAHRWLILSESCHLVPGTVTERPASAPDLVGAPSHMLQEQCKPLGNPALH